MTDQSFDERHHILSCVDDDGVIQEGPCFSEERRVDPAPVGERPSVRLGYDPAQDLERELGRTRRGEKRHVDERVR